VLEFHGVICHCGLAIFESFTPALVVGLRAGVWERIFKLLAEDADNEYAMIDATIVRAHQHSAGAKKKSQKRMKPLDAVPGDSAPKIMPPVMPSVIQQAFI